MNYLISLAGSGGVSGRMPIAQLGVRYKGKQKIEITRVMLAEVVANFRKRDTGEVPIDYDHAMETAAGSGGPVPAAGWIKSIDDAPDRNGILWAMVQWTQKAAEMIRAGEYKYVSPVLDPAVRGNKNGEPQGWTLTSAALTNTPVLQGMPALVLSEIGWVERTGRESGQMNCDYTNGWNSVQIEIDRRTREMMATDRRLGYGDAFKAVMAADPALARQRWAAVELQITERVKQSMATNSQLTYATALTGVLMQDSNLAREYRLARIGAPLTGAAPIGDPVGVEISALATEKLAASEGSLDYSAALRWVLGNRPDLARRYKDSMR